MNVLHIEASPTKAASRTRAVALHFLQALQSAQPNVEVRTEDVWAADLPAFDERMIAAKFAVLRAQAADAEQRTVWSRALRLSKAFNEADLYVFSVPMWNFSIPYRLKHYIDVITLPGSNWSWTAAAGYRGLLSRKRALLIYSSAGPHGLSGTGSDDFQKAYMRRWLAFLGVEEVSEINVAPTLAPPDAVARAVDAAKEEAERIAGCFAEPRAACVASPP